MLELGVGDAVVLDAEVPRLGAFHAAEVGHERVVGVEHELGGRGALGGHRGPAVGDRVELAVAVELVAEQVGEQHRARVELLDHRRRARTRRPRTARGRRRARARRGARRRPARRRRRPPCSPRRGCGRAGGRCARGSTATIAAVVVLPLVAEMTRLPCSSRPASSPIACGSRRVSSLPGSDVPPPRPARRASAPTALAAATLGASRLTATITRSAPGCTRTVAGRSAIGSPSACTLNGRSAWNATSRACTSSTPGSQQVRPVEHLGQRAEVLALGDVADHHDVQHAVVELGVGGEVHPAAEHAGVADRHRVAGERARLAVEHDLPVRRPPRPHRAQRGVDVDELAELRAQLRRVGEVAGVGVQARGGDAEVGAAVDVGDVDRAARAPAPARRRPPPGRCRAPSLRAKSLPRPPGSTASTPSVPRSSPAIAPSSPSPPIAAATSPSATVERASSRACSIECVRSTRNATPWPRSAASTAGQQLGRAAAARARVGDQADRPRHFASPSSRSQAATPAGSEVTT